MSHPNQLYSLRFNQFSELWDSRVQIDDKKAVVVGVPYRRFAVKKHTLAELVLVNLTMTEVKLIAERYKDDAVYLQFKSHDKRKWESLAALP